MALTAILLIIWFTSVISMLGNLLPVMENLGILERGAVVIIILIGAPIMGAASIVTWLLDCFLDEGWDELDEDDDEWY